MDKKILGTLDQANDCLIIYHDLPIDNLYKNSQDLMINLNEVVDKLFERSLQLKKVWLIHSTYIHIDCIYCYYIN